MLFFFFKVIKLFQRRHVQVFLYCSGISRRFQMSSCAGCDTICISEPAALHLFIFSCTDLDEPLCFHHTADITWCKLFAFTINCVCVCVHKVVISCQVFCCAVGFHLHIIEMYGNKKKKKSSTSVCEIAAITTSETWQLMAFCILICIFIRMSSSLTFHPISGIVY